MLASAAPLQGLAHIAAGYSTEGCWAIVQTCDTDGMQSSYEHTVVTHDDLTKKGFLRLSNH
jgi:hypothetical protein